MMVLNMVFVVFSHHLPEIGTQSARKLPLCGNATTRKSFAIGNAAADHIFGPSSVLIETSANASSSASQYPPNKNLADAWASPRLTVRSAANTSSASPRTYQSSVVGDALRVSPVHNLDKFQTKPSSFLEKLPEAIPKNIPWPSINGGNDDVFSLPHALNEDRAFNDCAIPTNTSEANANPFGGNSCLSVDPILRNDSKVANLLRIRFPHFTSISALKQGYFIGSEQVYIDYGYVIDFMIKNMALLMLYFEAFVSWHLTEIVVSPGISSQVARLCLANQGQGFSNNMLAKLHLDQAQSGDKLPQKS